MAIFALCSRPIANRQIQSRLSVPGLVATCFEGDRAGNAVKELEDIFAEKEGNGRSSRESAPCVGVCQLGVVRDIKIQLPSADSTL